MIYVIFLGFRVYGLGILLGLGFVLGCRFFFSWVRHLRLKIYGLVFKKGFSILGLVFWVYGLGLRLVLGLGLGL